jgi:hypothetical protein
MYIRKILLADTAPDALRPAVCVIEDRARFARPNTGYSLLPREALMASAHGKPHGAVRHHSDRPSRGGGFGYALLAPLAMAVALTAFAFLVAALQAYVFAVLTCIYLNDALHPGH